MSSMLKICFFFFLFSEEAKEQEDKTDTATHDGNSVTLALTPKQRHNSKTITPQTTP